MAELWGKEAEMLKEPPLELPAVAEVEKVWNDLRASSEALEGQRDRWGFCASEVLYPESLFCLGLNPSEPRGARHARFGLKGLIEYGGIFNPLRGVAARLKWNYSYFDLFCFRRSNSRDLHDNLPKLLKTEAGRHAVAAMIELARQALKTASPKAIYVCNGTAREIVWGRGKLSGYLRGAGLTTAFFFASPTPLHLPFPTGKRTMHFYYTVTRMSGRPIPVVLGMDITNTRGMTNEVKEKLLDFLAQTFEDALPDPEDFYRKHTRGR